VQKLNFVLNYKIAKYGLLPNISEELVKDYYRRY